MRFRGWLLLGLGGLALSACAPDLPTDVASAPTLGDFVDADPRPAQAGDAGGAPRVERGGPRPSAPPTDPFEEPMREEPTRTRFKPDLAVAFDALKANGQPTTTLEVYQIKGELEVREMRLMLERATFKYAGLHEGDQIGDGRLDVGTPPKMSLPATVTVTETDGVSYALAAVKASNLLASVYVADLRIKQVNGHLSVISISNFARGNNRHGQRTTQASARIVQRIFPGYVQLPAEPGTLRMRTLVYSETDPDGGQEGLRVFEKTLDVAP